ncbi:hypothetical protein [Kitasatospora sp. NPDC057500]|uniref:D-alanine--D-alanine ligase family protein n=1 Tax=Kitasatospora sp. NPDC057500 TaxID=3346151 RepID=UPI0036CE7C37
MSDSPRGNMAGIGIIVGGKQPEKHELLLRSAAVTAEVFRVNGHEVRLAAAGDPRTFDELRAMDVAFLGLADDYAEHGTFQGVLETMGIPYTGSGIAESARSMHKPGSKERVAAVGVDVLPQVGGEELDEAGPDGARLAAARIGLPAIVKPESEGCSAGISVAHSLEELAATLALHRAEGRKVFVEPFIAGRSVTVGVLQDADGTCGTLPVLEIESEREFSDHDAKHGHSSTRVCPADIPAGVAARVAEAAVIAHQALGCTGYSRSDFVLAADGRAYWLELNALPSLREKASFATAAGAAGITYGDLMLRVLSTSAYESGSPTRARLRSSPTAPASEGAQ